MRRIIITTLVALTALGGVASADRGHRDHHRNDRNNGSWHANGGVTVQRRAQRPVVRYQSQPRYTSSYRYQPRSYTRVVRRPIYVQRPVIRYRYYNYYQRPTLLVENYPARDGYYWVAGQWSWSGYEWIWTPGHYEPDPSYDSQYYDNSYDSSYTNGGYYDEYGNWVNTSY